MIEFMSANVNQRISSGDFGREVRLSAAQVSRLFKKETGISPSEYLIRLRMERAAHLLSNSLLSVKEIMATTGFGNRGHSWSTSKGTLVWLRPNTGSWFPDPSLAASVSVAATLESR